MIRNEGEGEDQKKAEEGGRKVKATHRGDIRVHTHAEEPQRAAGRHAEPPHTWQQHSVQHGSDCLPTKDTKYQVKDEK